SAAKPERENLANIRKGEYEVLAQVLGKDQSRDPDFGPAKIHPTAGATAVGAREQIINFNVNLNTSDMNLAKDIARRIRTSGGGLPHLRAKEIELGGQGKVQVSTVLGNYKVTGLKTVCENIEKIAGSAGVSITESELVGVVPSRALEECAMSQLRVKGFDPDKQILEIKLLELFLSRLEGRADSGAGISWENGLNAFCDALAKPDPIPGGGSASAGAAAMGIALMQKVFSLQIKRNVKEGKPAVEQQRLESLMTKLCGWSRRFRELAQEDALSFEAVTKAYKIPKTDPSRSASIQGAFKKACDVPLETLSLAVEAVNALSPEKNSVHPSVASDFKVGIYCLVAAQMGAKENVLINLDSIKDENYKAQMTAKLKTLEGTVRVAEKV
ncbi:MAG: cyclodeaminase/cyclohydrolase family protein, partial [Elusimicrobia bacterium]|nr:cyclodeaminase/cyclohydrolase family protein [Elusimicrobiota bacterium]